MQRKTGAKSIRITKKNRKVTLGPVEKKRLIQLILCFALFFIVFIGKSVNNTVVLQSKDQLLELIQSDTDFVGVFSALGESVSDGNSVLTSLKEVAMKLFWTAEQQQEQLPEPVMVNGAAAQAAMFNLSSPPSNKTMLDILSVSYASEESDQKNHEESPDATSESVSLPEIPPYTGPALPAGATMEFYDLGLKETVTPVSGAITSPYGYRDHPVSGEFLFHYGVDLAVDVGTPILAFADGTVDFIGESEVYGLYIQLNHGNGITTFYCHCSELFARKGESVAMGQIIAKTGDSGNATGPHLHMELKQNDIYLNPSYYIETSN